jgi:hypothetical protein
LSDCIRRLQDIDCKTATVEMVEHVDTTFKLTIDGPAATASGAVPVYGFCSWFDVMFTGKAGLAGHTVTLSTAPAIDKPVPGVDAEQREGSTQTPTGLTEVNPVTHWKQTLWFTGEREKETASASLFVRSHIFSSNFAPD